MRQMVYKEEDILGIAAFAHRNGPARAVKNFIDNFPNLTESTIRGGSQSVVPKLQIKH